MDENQSDISIPLTESVVFTNIFDLFRPLHEAHDDNQCDCERMLMKRQMRDFLLFVGGLYLVRCCCGSGQTHFVVHGPPFHLVRHFVVTAKILYNSKQPIKAQVTIGKSRSFINWGPCQKCKQK